MQQEWRSEKPHPDLPRFYYLYTTSVTTSVTNTRQRQGCSEEQTRSGGETGRNHITKLTEHKRAARKGDLNNHIAEHHRLTNRTIDWDSVHCLTYNTDYFQRLTLESGLNNLEQTPFNRYQLLPAPNNDLFTTLTFQTKRTERANFTDGSKPTETPQFPFVAFIPYLDHDCQVEVTLVRRENRLYSANHFGRQAVEKRSIA